MLEQWSIVRESKLKITGKFFLEKKVSIIFNSRRFTYDELMKVESITSAVSSLALSFGEGGSEKIMSRPFGVALLFAGIDKKGPRYQGSPLSFAAKFHY